MTASTRHLSNSELGRVLGLSPSGASKLRNGNVLPGAETMRAIVKELGGDWDELNAAQITAKQGDPQPWSQLLERLTVVRDGVPAA